MKRVCSIFTIVLLVMVTGLQGCPKDWQFLSKSCYYKPDTKLTYKSALAFCHKFNATLVNINSEEENNLVYDTFVRKPKFHNTYIGVVRKEHQRKTFVTSEGKPQTYFKWAFLEPNNFGKHEDCVEMKKRVWNDIPCNKKLPFVCELNVQCDMRPCDNAKQCINEGTSFKCVCLPGWRGQKCEKKGSGCGDPHYSTFDGKRYNFMGKCEYVFAKDCSSDHAFEVLQQNEACGDGSVSCTRSVRVLFQGREVKLQRAGVIYVDGTRIQNFPWTQTGSTMKITRYRRGALLDVPDLLFSVQWDGGMCIVVNVNQRHEGNMCGLVGNADGNSTNDFQLPDKSFTTDIKTFANSWKKNPRCVNGIVPPDPCKQLSQTNYDDIKEKCGKMKQPPFKQCNVKITPDIGYIPNCEYDMCAMKQNPTTAWCQALEVYDRDCTSIGVNIDWEGKPDFLDCGNPCAEMQCFNGGRCENINKIKFRCICPTGFSGPTCKNVECKSGYVARGSVCYKKMTKIPWMNAECPTGEEFMYVEDEDENNFIYEEFVKSSKNSFWLNAHVCGIGKLCAQNSAASLFYHNLCGPFPASGCVQMPCGKNGIWITENCNIASYYICKYRKH